MDWINVVENKDKRQAVVWKVTNLRLPCNAWISLLAEEVVVSQEELCSTPCCRAQWPVCKCTVWCHRPMPLSHALLSGFLKLVFRHSVGMSGRNSALHKTSACTVRSAKGRHSQHHQVPATEDTCSCTSLAPRDRTQPDPETVRLHVTHYTLVTVICKHTVLGAWCYLHNTIAHKHRTHARSIWQTPRTSSSTNGLFVLLHAVSPAMFSGTRSCRLSRGHSKFETSRHNSFGEKNLNVHPRYTKYPVPTHRKQQCVSNNKAKELML